jgi:hypothetical protein
MRELLCDPLFDVASSVAEVPADTEAGWTVASVAPGVDGGYRDVEEPGEILGGEQRFEIVHRPNRRLQPSQLVINSRSALFRFGCFPWSEACLGAAIQSPAPSISREGGDGWALFGRVFERVSESLLKGCGALIAVMERLVRPTIGWDSRVDTDRTPAGTASVAPTRPPVCLPGGNSSIRSASRLRVPLSTHGTSLMVASPGNTSHSHPQTTQTPTERTSRFSPRSTLSRRTALHDTRICTQSLLGVTSVAHAHNTLLRPRGDRLSNPRGHPGRSLRLRPRSPTEARDGMSTNRPRRQPPTDRRVHTCGERVMGGLR